MNNKTKILCGAIFVSLISTQGFAVIMTFTLPQLVHEAPMIVIGHISIQEGAVFIDVEKTLKGQEHQRLQVRYSPWFEVTDPRFENGEAVLLFLTPNPDPMILYFSSDVPTPKEEEMYLFGLGDQGKWPRVYPEEWDKHKSQIRYPELLEAASLDDIEGIVAKLLLIEDASAGDDRVAMCLSYLRTPEPLLQHTILEYIECNLLWPPLSEVSSPQSYEEARRRLDVKREFGREVMRLSLLDANEPDLRQRAVWALQWEPSAEVIPPLIERITDESARVRSGARNVLRTQAQRLRLTDTFATSLEDDSLEHCKSVQEQWRQWWRLNKTRVQGNKSQ